MPEKKPAELLPGLDSRANEEKRRESLQKRCEQFRENLRKRKPQDVATMAAMSLQAEENDSYTLIGEYLLNEYRIKWPEIEITSGSGKEKPAPLHIEALWLHYLERADGHPLAGRWVNLSEIGGLFYQQAFQGYCGDELAETWGNNIDGLRKSCLAAGGWPLNGPGDLAFEWRVLPRLPLSLCYRLPSGADKAWATILFDASAGHYVAADVAATVGKSLADRLKPA